MKTFHLFLASLVSATIGAHPPPIEYVFYAQVNGKMIPLSGQALSGARSDTSVFYYDDIPMEPTRFMLEKNYASTDDAMTPGYVGFYKGGVFYGGYTTRTPLMLGTHGKVVNHDFFSCHNNTSRYVITYSTRGFTCFPVLIYLLPYTKPEHQRIVSKSFSRASYGNFDGLSSGKAEKEPDQEQYVPKKRVQRETRPRNWNMENDQNERDTIFIDYGETVPSHRVQEEPEQWEQKYMVKHKQVDSDSDFDFDSDSDSDFDSDFDFDSDSMEDVGAAVFASAVSLSKSRSGGSSSSSNTTSASKASLKAKISPEAKMSPEALKALNASSVSPVSDKSSSKLKGSKTQASRTKVFKTSNETETSSSKVFESSKVSESDIHLGVNTTVTKKSTTTTIVCKECESTSVVWSTYTDYTTYYPTITTLTMTVCDEVCVPSTMIISTPTNLTMTGVCVVAETMEESAPTESFPEPESSSSISESSFSPKSAVTEKGRVGKPKRTVRVPSLITPTNKPNSKKTATPSAQNTPTSTPDIKTFVSGASRSIVGACVLCFAALLL